MGVSGQPPVLNAAAVSAADWWVFTILVAMVIATIFAFHALVWLLVTNLVDGTLAGSTSDVFCGYPA